MAIDYQYYLRGSNIALVQKSKTTNEYVSPTTSITNGLMLEYSALPTIPDDENDPIDIAEELAMAAVEYVKAKFAENANQYDKRNFHMNEFKRIVYQHQRNRFGGIRRMVDKEPYAVR